MTTPVETSSSSSPYNNYSMMSHNLLQMQVLNKVLSNINLNTGDPFLDNILMTLLQGFLLSMLASATMNITTLLNLLNTQFKYYISLFINLFYRFYYYLLSKYTKKSKIFLKTVELSYITDSKDINELYKAVSWYLSNNEKIDYLSETSLNFTFIKKIALENKSELIDNNLLINKFIPFGKNKTILYKNRKITYKLSNDLITLYTDREKKRENPKITLWADIDEYDKTDIIEEFCQNCLQSYVNSMISKKWVQQIYTHTKSEWKNGPSNNFRKMETIVLKNNLKKKVKEDLDWFLSSEDWYRDRDIPYYRGYLFHGEPGTGKTSMIKAMSLYAKRHIHYLMLSEISSDSELVELLKKIDYKTTILVIEDIDAMTKIVNSRVNDNENNDKLESLNNSNDKETTFSNQEKQPKSTSTLTLSGLLNVLDGVFSPHGRILIITTNHPERLDKALLRPGRCDCKYVFDNCNREQIKELYYLYFNDFIDNKDLEFIEENKYSPAHISSLFQLYRNNPKEAFYNLDVDLATVDLTTVPLY
jgi:SpoVK/Ycf46/Vps4 family AAA+-type ATPase